MRSRFESQLEDLQKDMVFMGALCEEIINCSLEGLNGPESLDQERIQQTYLHRSKAGKKPRTIAAGWEC